MAGGARDHSRVSFTWALIPFRRAPSSWPTHPPAAYLLIPSHWGLGFEHEFGRTQAFRDYLHYFFHFIDEDLRPKEVKSLFTVTQPLRAGTGWPLSSPFLSWSIVDRCLSKYPLSLLGASKNASLVFCSPCVLCFMFSAVYVFSRIHLASEGAAIPSTLMHWAPLCAPHWARGGSARPHCTHVTTKYV